MLAWLPTAAVLPLTEPSGVVVVLAAVAATATWRYAELRPSVRPVKGQG
ncbi:hypothetical protein H0H10_26580 [Streptomyces sp. TRM S81-3]|uniref:Uncharacterized protein n=1 Tax=Streptomyces griseicoloratus TaxID=2752516 RepID=A0A926QT34_9ACTN|nr:hypothetical protein [Streptomyces griseicoloratus]MBD0422681.1 hypothetical protein [Streptomyces griseicoloratus]